MAEFSGEDRTYIRRFLEEKFNLSELKTLAFDLGVDYEMFPHATKPEFSRELVAYFERKDQLHPLVKGMIEARSDDELTRILARLPQKDGLEKVQIILSNDRLKSKPDLKQKLAELLGISTDEVMLIATAAGSIKLLVGLPPAAIADLQRLALPYRLDEYEIVGVDPFVNLPRLQQERWRTTFQSTAGGLLKGGGIGLLGKVLLWMLGTIGVILLLGGGGVALWWQGLPQLTIVNECGRTLPIPVPDLGRTLLGLPDKIPPDGSVDFKVITGSGVYRLAIDERPDPDVVVLRLPQTMPIVDIDELRLGQVDQTTRFLLNGQPVEIPSDFPVGTDRSNVLVLCARTR